MPILTVALAVLAAAGNATASVLQRKAARREPESRSFSFRLMWDLAHQPVWAGGICAVIIGFLLQAVALGLGSLAVVQPLLVLELPFTLLLASVVFRARLHAREWLAAAGMSAGLAAFLYTLRPGGGNAAQVTLSTWLLGIAVSLALAATFVWLGVRQHQAARAVYLSVATGIGFGLTAVLVKGVATAYSGSVASLFGAWQTYLVMALGPASMFLLQNTLQSGRLVAAQPGLTLVNPVVAVAWGVAVFSESVRTGLWLTGAFAGAGLIVACTVLLARSPLLHGQGGAVEEGAGSSYGPSGTTPQEQSEEAGHEQRQEAGCERSGEASHEQDGEATHGPGGA